MSEWNGVPHERENISRGVNFSEQRVLHISIHRST